MAAHQTARSVAPGEPTVPLIRPLATPTSTPSITSRLVRIRSILNKPAKVAAGLWAAGAMTAFAISFTSQWGDEGRAIIIVIAGLCLVIGGVLFVLGDRLPHWALHVGGVASLAMVTVGSLVGPSGHVDFADLYIWVVVYAALYFSPIAVIAYTAGVGILYAILLTFGPSIDNPVAAWLAIFGTSTIVATVVLGLVTMLRSDARADSLTGLPNRRSWDERLEEELERNRRSGESVSVAVIDLDGFKAVNDHQGHDAGDALLQDLSAAWQGVVRSGGDFLARLGGDEFGLLAPGSDAVGARRLAKRLAEVTPSGIAYSVGVATWDGEETATGLVRRADQSMYRSKLLHQGRR